MDPAESKYNVNIDIFDNIQYNCISSLNLDFYWGTLNIVLFCLRSSLLLQVFEVALPFLSQTKCCYIVAFELSKGEQLPKPCADKLMCITNACCAAYSPIYSDVIPYISFQNALLVDNCCWSDVILFGGALPLWIPRYRDIQWLVKDLDVSEKQEASVTRNINVRIYRIGCRIPQRTRLRVVVVRDWDLNLDLE